jgi:hypothetical protein
LLDALNTLTQILWSSGNLPLDAEVLFDLGDTF